LAGRISVAVPVRLTYAGVVPDPEETLRRPCRVPGCDGAKVMTTEQLVPPARTAGQLVELMKSPVSERVSGKDCVLVLVMFALCVFAEVVVTTTGFWKVIEAGVTTRLGLADEPATPGCGMVSPVTSTLRPWSRARVTESEDVCGER